MAGECRRDGRGDRETPTSPESPSGQSQPWAMLAGGTLIVLTALVAYANSFSGPFIFDDLSSIPHNPSIRRWSSIGQVLHPPSNGETVTGRPLLNLSFAINYALGGTRTWGYHAANLAIHIVNALMLLAIIRCAFRSPPLKDRFGRAAEGLSLTIALLWVVHPIQTESVTYIVQRAESLSAMFYLLTLFAVIRATQSKHSIPWYVAAVSACVLGMATKETVATAPLVVLLYDRTFLAGSWRQAWQRRRGLYIALAATWLLLAPLMIGTAGRNATAGFGYGLAPWEYAMVQCVAIARYLRLSFWPVGLCLDYGPFVTRTWGEAVPGAILVATLVFATAWALVRRPAAGFVGAFFFIVLAPTSSIVPIVTQTIAEHRMYLALSAVGAAVVATAYTAGRGLIASGRVNVPIARVAAVCLVTSATIALVLLTLRRNETYRTELSIFQDTVAKAPENPQAHFGLATALASLDRTSESIEHFQQALRLQPDYAPAHNNLGLILSQLGRNAEAIEHYKEVVRIDPKHFGAQNNLGLALISSGRPEESIEHFQQALKCKPDCAAFHSNLAVALSRAGRTQEAIEHYRQALALDPDYAEAHANLGLALVRAGRPHEAIEHYQWALRIRPAYHEARLNLGIALARMGRMDEAIQQFQEGVQHQPDNAPMRFNLGVALSRAGRQREAVAQLDMASRQSPSDAAIQYGLAWLLATRDAPEEGDGARAVELAEHARSLMANPDAGCLDALAAAYAAAGRFDDAVLAADQARRMAESWGQTSLAQDIHVRLQLYRDRKPYREPVDTWRGN